MNEYLITEEQVESLDNSITRFGLPINIQGLLGEQEVIMLQFENIWLGIEPDGYTHS
jgi:hypothetical protein